MRKINAGLFVAADGVAEAPDTWQFPYFDDEMGAAVAAQIAASDTLLLGRVTYDLFAAEWPAREADGGEEAGMAKTLGDVRKIVVSRSPQRFTWRNSEHLQGDLVEAVTRLKKEPGGPVGMTGSISVVRQLLAARLLDELHLFLHPIAVGRGARLFTESGTPIRLKLLSCEVFNSGVLYAVYGPAEEE